MHVLKTKTDKLESLTKVCLLVGYLKATRGGLFYCPQEYKVFVLINATLLKDSYINDSKPQSKDFLENLMPKDEYISKQVTEDKKETIVSH